MKVDPRFFAALSQQSKLFPPPWTAVLDELGRCEALHDKEGRVIWRTGQEFIPGEAGRLIVFGVNWAYQGGVEPALELEAKR